jgi:hypothetical protein
MMPRRSRSNWTTLISAVWEGKFGTYLPLYFLLDYRYAFYLLDTDILDFRTMVWAIDLDDGSLLEALTSVSTKKKEEVLPELDFDTPDFGTNWDFIPESEKHKRDEL